MPAPVEVSFIINDLLLPTKYFNDFFCIFFAMHKTLGNYLLSIQCNLDRQLVKVRLQQSDVREAEHLDRAFEKKESGRENERIVCVTRERERFQGTIPFLFDRVLKPPLMDKTEFPSAQFGCHFNWSKNIFDFQKEFEFAARELNWRPVENPVRDFAVLYRNPTPGLTALPPARRTPPHAIQPARALACRAAPTCPYRLPAKLARPGSLCLSSDGPDASLFPVQIPCHLVCQNIAENSAMVAHVDLGLTKGFPNRLNNSVEPIFVRVKMFRRSLLAYGLIDTGNLSYSLVSESLYNSLKIPLSPSIHRLRSACGDHIEVLGEISSLPLIFEGAKRPIHVRDLLVVRNLSVPVNLSLRFLYSQGVDVHCDPSGPKFRTLTTGSDTIPLFGLGRQFLSNSQDPRIQKMVDKLKNKEQNPVRVQMENKTVLATPTSTHAVEPQKSPAPPLHTSCKKRPYAYPAPGLTDLPAKPMGGCCANPTEKVFKVCDFHPENFICYVENGIVLKPNSKTVVKVKVPHLPAKPPETPLLFSAENHRNYFQKWSIFPVSGVYTPSPEPQTMLLYVDNVSDTEVLLPASVRLGSIRLPDKLVQHILPSSETTRAPIGVHQLDHRPPNQLSKAEKAERIKFLVDNVSLEQSMFNVEQKKKLLAMLLEYWDAVSVSPDDFGDNKQEVFSLKLKPGSKPHRDKVRALNPLYAKDLDRQLSEWSTAQVIAPSRSPWGAALVPVRKKGTTKLRWAVDYRPLNSMIEADSFPLPNIEDNLSKLQGSTVFSSLDSAGAFHGIRVDPDSQPLTAFVCPRGSFQFLKMPFGICNAPSCYARMVARALETLPGESAKYALAYLDDIVVHSRDPEQHLEHLRLVLQMHKNNGMKLQLRKCAWARKQVEYLGHSVSAEGISMNESYVKRVKDWPLPKNVAELRSFLGTAGYYRSFFPQYGELTSELESMKSQKKGPLTWTPTAIQRFEKLKSLFLTSPVRAYPDFSEGAGRMILETDFSEDARSAVLLQEDPGGGPHKFLGCAASKNSPCERNYSSNKGELAAVIMGLRKFESLLLWRPFVIRTDNACVSFLRNLKQNKGIYSRWKEQLASYDFTIEHRSGRSNYFADSLSRRVDLDRSDEVEDDIEQTILDVYNIILDEAVPEQSQFEGLGEITLQELQAETAADEVLQKVLPYVRDGNPPSPQDRKKMTLAEIHYANLFPVLIYRHQVLVIKTPSGFGEEMIEKLVIPDALRGRVFRAAHGGGPAGHHGVSRTYENLRARVYFPRMRTFVEQQVGGCVSCFNKLKKNPSKSHIQHREHTGRPGARIHVDIVGPLSRAKYHGQEVMHVLTILDAFTRHLTAVPLASTASADIVDALLERHVYLFGVPECIHSDRGANFVSSLFEGLMKKMNILHTKTPPYTPEGNRVERYHQTLSSLLRTEDPALGSWVDNLPAAVFAINTAVNRITGITPFEATFGRLARVPLDLILPPEVQVEDDQPVEAYINDLHTRLSRAYRHMLNTEEKSIRRETARDAARTGRTFSVGDRVSLFCPRAVPGVARKLQRHWHGPYIITKMVNTHLVKVQAEGTWAKNRGEIDVVVDRLKKWTLSPTPEQLTTAAEEPEVFSDLTDEIDTIHPQEAMRATPSLPPFSLPPEDPLPPPVWREETSGGNTPDPEPPKRPPSSVHPPYHPVEDEFEEEIIPTARSTASGVMDEPMSTVSTPRPDLNPFPQGLPAQLSRTVASSPRVLTPLEVEMNSPPIPMDMETPAVALEHQFEPPMREPDQILSPPAIPSLGTRLTPSRGSDSTTVSRIPGIQVLNQPQMELPLARRVSSRPSTAPPPLQLELPAPPSMLPLPAPPKPRTPVPRRALPAPFNKTPIPLPMKAGRQPTLPPIPLPAPPLRPPPLPPMGRQKMKSTDPPNKPSLEEIPRRGDVNPSPAAGEKRIRKVEDSRISRVKMSPTVISPPPPPSIPLPDTPDEVMRIAGQPTIRPRRHARQAVDEDMARGRISPELAEENSRHRSRSRSAHRRPP